MRKSVEQIKRADLNISELDMFLVQTAYKKKKERAWILVICCFYWVLGIYMTTSEYTILQDPNLQRFPPVFFLT